MTAVQKLGLTGNSIKLIATIAMLIDHITYIFTYGFAILEPYTAEWFILRLPGRITAPIMCYFVAEAFFYTSNKKRYALQLLILAALSHFPYVLMFEATWWKTTTVIWGFFLGFIALWIVKNDKVKLPLKLLTVFSCLALSLVATYDTLTVLWILFFGIYRGNLMKQVVSFALVCLFGGISSIFALLLANGWNSWYSVAMLFAIWFILLYNGKRGKKSLVSKYGFYVFFPLHHLILYLIVVFFAR